MSTIAAIPAGPIDCEVESVAVVVEVPPSAANRPAAPSRNGAAMQIVAMPEMTGSHMSSLS